MTTKRCSTCGEVKPLRDFHCRRSSPDGRQYHCKHCHYHIARRWQTENAQLLNERRRNGITTRPTPELCLECIDE